MAPLEALDASLGDGRAIARLCRAAWRSTARVHPDAPRLRLQHGWGAHRSCMAGDRWSLRLANTLFQPLPPREGPLARALPLLCVEVRKPRGGPALSRCAIPKSRTSAGVWCGSCWLSPRWPVFPARWRGRGWITPQVSSLLPHAPRGSEGWFGPISGSRTAGTLACTCIGRGNGRLTRFRLRGR